MADNLRGDSSINYPKTLNPSKKKKQQEEKDKATGSQFEFCKVCNLNHDQGLRHKYFPSHKKSLSTYLSRFQSKLADVRFFLKNPCPLRSEHAFRNRFWCVFCDVDVIELGSSFACNNAINHLSSADHLKNLKHFLWKYGGGMDRLDSFRILDADVAKWQKKYATQKKEAPQSEERCHGPLPGLSNDIHREHNVGTNDHFENSCSVYPLHSSILSAVTPLQYSTTEYQIFHSEVAGGANAGNLPISPATSHANLPSADIVNGCANSQLYLPYQSSCYFLNGSHQMDQVYLDGGLRNGVSASHGVEGNVHSGAAPPWLDSSEHSLVDYDVKTLSVTNASNSNKPENSRKLNPKRVGAAWAEKRKIEMELERRGEITKSQCDSSWLPNFGRVWQSGSRKESRKEFEMENQKLGKAETQIEISKEIKPYISKRACKEKEEGAAE